MLDAAARAVAERSAASKNPRRVAPATLEGASVRFASKPPPCSDDTTSNDVVNHSSIAPEIQETP